jgi:hypothetical protein
MLAQARDAGDMIILGDLLRIMAAVDDDGAALRPA